MQCKESQKEKNSKAKIRSTHTELPDKKEDLCKFSPIPIENRILGTRDVPEDQLQTCIDLLQKYWPTNIAW